MLTTDSPPVRQSTVEVITISKSVGGDATSTFCSKTEQPLASTTLI